MSQLSADFLVRYGFLMDFARLSPDRPDDELGRTRAFRYNVASIKTIAGATSYHRLLEQYPDITRLESRPKEAKHVTRHHIETTPGPPMICRLRRLAPDRLAAAKKEFQRMVEIEIVRPLKSCWAASLHPPEKGRRMAALWRLQDIKHKDYPRLLPGASYSGFRPGTAE